jgi:HD superfamily phosphohydrolase
VFPSAAYSRFSHSVGTCHNADRILTAIETNQSARRFSDEERQAFRIAALFHDLGHYPFSHTTEHAIKRFFRDGIYKRTGAGDDQGELAIETEPGTPPAYLDHEDTGKLIFLEDSEIDAAFKAAGRISKSDVQSVFLDEKLSTVISSDLDCDRLDYLKRTALHSGAPYGAVDVDFIISKATVDNGGRFCFGRKAIRASDHLLVSRFYDFMQIPYQKTVAALEWSLEEAVIHLLRHRVLVLSEADMLALDHLAAVLHRKPAKMIYNWECLVDFLSTEQETREQLLEYKLRDAAQRLGLDRRRFTIWKAPFKLSKAGPMLQGSPEDRDYSDEEQQQLIHVLDKGGTSVPLIDLPSAVSHHLAKVRYRVLRVYYLPRGSDFPDAIGQLREALAD